MSTTTSLSNSHLLKEVVINLEFQQLMDFSVLSKSVIVLDQESPIFFLDYTGIELSHSVTTPGKVNCGPTSGDRVVVYNLASDLLALGNKELQLWFDSIFTLFGGAL